MQNTVKRSFLYLTTPRNIIASDLIPEMLAHFDCDRCFVNAVEQGDEAEGEDEIQKPLSCELARQPAASTAGHCASEKWKTRCAQQTHTHKLCSCFRCMHAES